MKLVDNLKTKWHAFAEKCLRAYFDYQIMLKIPTIYQPCNDGFTRIQAETLSENADKGITCCCKTEVRKGEHLNETNDDYCPVCKRTILWEEVQQRPAKK